MYCFSLCSFCKIYFFYHLFFFKYYTLAFLVGTGCDRVTLSSFSSVKFVNEGLPHLGLLVCGVARLIALLSFFGSFRRFFVCNILVALAMIKSTVINNIL